MTSPPPSPSTRSNRNEIMPSPIPSPTSSLSSIESNDDDASLDSGFALRKKLVVAFDKHVDITTANPKAPVPKILPPAAGRPPRMLTATTCNNIKRAGKRNRNENSTISNGSSGAQHQTSLEVFLRIRPSRGVSTIEIIAPPPAVEGEAVPVSTIIRTFPPLCSAAGKLLYRAENNLHDSASTSSAVEKAVKDYNFHRVFGPEADQEEIYEAVAKPLVEGLFQEQIVEEDGRTKKRARGGAVTGPKGKSGMLFCYGITNAGKTHTMMGKLNSDGGEGILPRCLGGIFEKLEETDKIEISFLEIYNEKIYDLLSDNDACSGYESSGSTRSVSSRVGIGRGLKLREDPNTGVFVKDLTKSSVSDISEALSIAATAKRNRQTFSNNVNSASSRSHTICSITTPNDFSTLYLIDLAGSERLKRTNLHPSSTRHREAAIINSSLMKLMRCLTNQSTAIRESKLTHFFMGKLHKSTVRMVVNVNPDEEDFDESRLVLGYAVTAKNVILHKGDLEKRREKVLKATHSQDGRPLNPAKQTAKAVKGALAPTAASRSRNQECRVSNQSQESQDKSVASRPVSRKNNYDENGRLVKKAANDDNQKTTKGGYSPTKQFSRLAKKLSPKSFMAKTRREQTKQRKEKLKAMRGTTAPASSSNTQAKTNILESKILALENQVKALTQENQNLQEENEIREEEIRREVSESMDEQFQSIEEHYEGLLENARKEARANPTPNRSVMKLKEIRSKQALDDLYDRIEECEDEMVRMKERFATEKEELKDELLERDEESKSQKELMEEMEHMEEEAQETIISLKKQIVSKEQDWEKAVQQRDQALKAMDELILNDTVSNDEEEDNQPHGQNDENIEPHQDYQPIVSAPKAQDGSAMKENSKKKITLSPKKAVTSPKSSKKRSLGQVRTSKVCRSPLSPLMKNQKVEQGN